MEAEPHCVAIYLLFVVPVALLAICYLPTHGTRNDTTPNVFHPSGGEIAKLGLRDYRRLVLRKVSKKATEPMTETEKEKPFRGKRGNS